MPCKQFQAGYSAHPNAHCNNYAPFDYVSNMTPMPPKLYEIAAEAAFDQCTKSAYGVYSGNQMARCLTRRQKHLEVAYPF